MAGLRLLQFHASFGLPNASPFCFKLEAWMQLQGIDYEVVPTMDPRRAPKGKLPCIEDGDRTVADSRHILEYLKRSRGKDPEAALSPAQRAEAHAFTRMAEEHLYWVLVYSRWIDPGGFAHMGKAFARMPIPMRWIVPHVAVRNVRNQLHGQGLGRHSRDEIYAFGIEDVEALAARLEGDGFFHGEAPATVDTVLLATLANILWTPLRNPMVERARQLPSLDAYCRRAWTACFADRELPPGAQAAS